MHGWCWANSAIGRQVSEFVAQASASKIDEQAMGLQEIGFKNCGVDMHDCKTPLERSVPAKVQDEAMCTKSCDVSPIRRLQC